MSSHNDERIVLTLDAGGTNFVFAALRDGKRIGETVTLPAEPRDLDASFRNLTQGFDKVTPTGAKPAAISFAFPGPADYDRGVIDNVGNLPAYAGGVPLADMLTEHFGIPVYINNDGDLFAYGEASGGLLPEVNTQLAEAGCPRRYRNLIGVTLGTGLGSGIVIDGRLLRGDNSAAGEVWLLRHSDEPDRCIEEGVSIRAITRAYQEGGGSAPEGITPEQIARIARAEAPGEAKIAREAFARFGTMLGEALTSLITTIDGLVVIGGGLTGGYDLFAPSMFGVLNGRFGYPDGSLRRLVQQVLDLESPEGRQELLDPSFKRRTGIGLSRLGASEAVARGTYAYAVARLRDGATRSPSDDLSAPP